MSIPVSRLRANYACLSELYKRGAFEDPVQTSTDVRNQDLFYTMPVTSSEAPKNRRQEPALAETPERENATKLQFAAHKLFDMAADLITNLQG